MKSWTIVCITIISGAARGQAPVFEVAAIRPSPPVAVWAGFQTPGGGRFEGSHVTVKAMVAYAYGVRDLYVSGGPGWAASDQFEILAKADEGATPAQMRGMLQSLLAERFKVVARRETKELPVYDLALAKGGSKLQESSGAGGFVKYLGRGQIEGKAVPVAALTQYLSTELERIVLDKTGLAARYDFKLSWTPGEGLSEKLKISDTAPLDPGGASLFTALQEQLGLKLEAAKGLVETIVIDHVERPSGN
ncbi:MAG TPA: TIGR03435 family protein [Bryobacteraceae bacterium]|jgi:uncharacterized protein (TIGR03435 family)